MRSMSSFSPFKGIFKIVPNGYKCLDGGDGMVIYRGSGNVKRRLKPSEEAKNALLKLYGWQKAQTPVRLTIENFYPIDIERLVKILGWSLEKRDIAGYSQYDEPLDAFVDYDEKTIFISTGDNVSRGRMNFSLAHEIGHILLHGEEGYGELNRTRSIGGKNPPQLSLLDQFEIEADRFAAELLMPKKAVCAHFQKLFSQPVLTPESSLSGKIIEKQGRKNRFSYIPTRKELAKWVAVYRPSPDEISLAQFFNVSQQAMSIRLLDLLLVME